MEPKYISDDFSDYKSALKFSYFHFLKMSF